MNLRRFALVITLILLVLVFVLAIRDGVNPFGNLTLILSSYAILFSLGEFKRKIIAKAKPAGKRTSKSEPFRQEFTPAGQWIFLLGAVLFIFFAVMSVAFSLWVFGVLFFLAILFVIFFIAPPKLILSQEGIELQTLSKITKFRWEDIEEIARYYDNSETILLRGNQRIPVSIFRSNPNRANVKEIIKENAPFLEFLE